MITFYLNEGRWTLAPFNAINSIETLILIGMNYLETDSTT
jgi:hypothetical protein